MIFSCATVESIPNAKPIKLITASSTYGIGLITSILLGWCHLFGISCDLYDRKIESAKNHAIKKLIKQAQELGATGIANVSFQIHGTTIFVYGIAFSR